MKSSRLEKKKNPEDAVKKNKGEKIRINKSLQLHVESKFNMLTGLTTCMCLSTFAYKVHYIVETHYENICTVGWFVTGSNSTELAVLVN